MNPMASPIHFPIAGLVLALCAPLSAQHRFSPVAKDYVPYYDQYMRSPVIADFDGNGALDVLERNDLFTNQNGRFVPWPTPLTGMTYGLGAYDFDGDGWPDVLQGSDPSYPAMSSVRVALNRLPSGFQITTLMPQAFSTAESRVVADFDGDGDLDIVLFPFSQSQLPVQLENDGTGGFTDVSALRMPQVHITAGTSWAVDVDLDGDTDIVVPSPTTSQLTWLENLGQGVMALPSSSRFPAGYSYILGMFDIDGDGDFDLATNSGAMLIAQPGGFVAVPQVFPPLLGPQRFRAADFDGDSDLDVWIEAFYGGGYFENVAGTFVDRRNPPIWRAANAVEITDVDNDGRMDILAATGRIEILLGQPAAQFFDLTRAPAIGGCYGDFDGDGLTDQFAQATSGTSTMFRKGLGAGDYVESLAFTGWIINYHEVVDLDGDGDLDVIGSGTSNTQLGFYFNDGAGHLTPSYPMLAPFTPVQGVLFAAPGDLDGDGDLDVVVNFDAPNRPPELLMFENQGAGSFVIKPAWTVPALQGTRFHGELFDADRDGDADLVLCGMASGAEPTLYANDGSGLMALVPGAMPALFPTTQNTPSKVLAGDVDGDGDVDLILPYLVAFFNHPEDAVLLRNNGTGGFSVGTLFNESSEWRTADLVDVDDDGDLDLVVTVYDSGVGFRIEIRSNDGTGSFAPAASGFFGPDSLILQGGPSRFVDVDDDGDVDVVGVSSQSTIVFNQTRHLRTVTQPRLGGSFDLEFAHPEPPAVRVAAILVSTNRLATPVVFPGHTPFVVDPAVGIGLLATGTSVIPASVPLPSHPAFLGLDLFAQAALLTNSSFAFTNAVHEVIID